MLQLTWYSRPEVGIFIFEGNENNTMAPYVRESVIKKHANFDTQDLLIQ